MILVVTDGFSILTKGSFARDPAALVASGYLLPLVVIRNLTDQFLCKNTNSSKKRKKKEK
jgi:hypothetical protein